MSFPKPIEGLSRRLAQAWRERAVGFKAASFALIGVVNTIVDAAIFFLAYALLASSPAATGVLASIMMACRCGSVATATLVAANTLSWTVAASGSYVMNSYITFAVESGGKLTPRAYAGFLASGLVGLLANTITLVTAAQFLPVWAAKGCAILVSFMVNFSMSHFVVFRRRGQTPGH
jgi:putative flippase GtrA